MRRVMASILFGAMVSSHAVDLNTEFEDQAESQLDKTKVDGKNKILTESQPIVKNYYTAPVDAPSYYIANNNYTQQAFASMFYMNTYREESSVSQHEDFFGHTFADGAWNLYANAGWMYSALPSSGWAASGGYSGLLWGQTGRTNGFALGAKLGVTLDNWGLTVAHNQFWGSGYGNGGFVSPYTVYNVTDPFYTSSLLAGMVEKGSAGQAYKYSVNVGFLDNSLLFTGAYAQYLTQDVSNYPNTAEIDFTVQYVMPNFHNALVFTGEFSYLQQPASLGGDLYSPVLWISYAY